MKVVGESNVETNKQIKLIHIAGIQSTAISQGPMGKLECNE